MTPCKNVQEWTSSYVTIWMEINLEWMMWELQKRRNGVPREEWSWPPASRRFATCCFFCSGRRHSSYRDRSYRCSSWTLEMNGASTENLTDVRRWRWMELTSSEQTPRDMLCLQQKSSAFLPRLKMQISRWGLSSACSPFLEAGYYPGSGYEGCMRPRRVPERLANH